MKKFFSIVVILTVVAATFVLGRQSDRLFVFVPDDIRVKADTARVYALACVYVDRAGEAHPVYDDPQPGIRKWLYEHAFEFQRWIRHPSFDAGDISCTAQGNSGKIFFGSLIYWR